MRRILALVVLATLAACGGRSDATSPSSQTQNKSFTGTYALQTFNGKALPYTFNFSTGDYDDAATKAVSITSTDQSMVFSGSVSSDFSTLTVSASTDIYVFKK